MSDLFENLTPPEQPARENKAEAKGPRPLAERLRPAVLEDVVGQDHILAADAPLGRMLANGTLASIIFWGPPGVGKTTIARLLAQSTGHRFVQISAIFSGVAELKKVFEAARLRHGNGHATLLFVDEIHRFNKAQQDAFLPLMEDGTIILVGATTENPSFELNAALLSRAQVLTLKRLEPEALGQVLHRAETEIGHRLTLTDAAREELLNMADGDGRALLNLVELLAQEEGEDIDVAGLRDIAARRSAQYDKSGDAHYNLISALHKSVRGSDPDAALYWLARMLEGGEDPRYLARRITRMAVEDIGLAAPQAQQICVGAWEVYERLGAPEGNLALAQAVVYLALAPKSNAVYRGFGAAMKAARETGSHPPPKHILNAPTRLMKDEGYGAGYVYDHDAEGGFSGQHYFPDGMERLSFYAPKGEGYEQKLRETLDDLTRRRAELAKRNM